MFTPHLFEYENRAETAGGETHQQSANLLAQASGLYGRAYWRGMVGRALAALTGHPRRLLVLSDVIARAPIDGRRYAGLQTVGVACIVGTESRVDDFDAAFHPLSSHDRYRWVSMAQTFLRFRAVPPVELIQVGGAYFVRDGHHRVSVARTVGQALIEAEVTVYEVEIRPETLPPAASAATACLVDCAA